LALRFELGGQDGQNKVDQRDHCAKLADSIAQGLGSGFRYTQAVDLR
jgi:hypothetical protein